jgi:hypothetical protein
MTTLDDDLQATVNAAQSLGASAHDAQAILNQLGPRCRDHARRQLILDQAIVNGIDYVEYEEVGGKPTLHVRFLYDLAAAAFGLVADPSAIRVHGGSRIVDISVVRATRVTPVTTRLLDVEVDHQGDFSPYLLSIGWSQSDTGAWRFVLPGVDRLFSVAPVNFRPGCPVDYDCLDDNECAEDELAEPALDYLARDYASFRQLLLDLVAQRNPRWVERSPADVGMALLELFAYEGDHLSYLQDAVANEMYLDTARRRSSAKRHSQLVDYAMHDGRNAWTHVHFGVKTAGTVPAHVPVVTRITEPLAFDRDPAQTPPPQPANPPGVELHRLSGLDAGIWFDDVAVDPALRRVRVFETVDAVDVRPANNELRIHAWGNERCCLPVGATMAHVYTADIVAGKAKRPPLKAGDLLLLEEILGPTTGAASDADPTHRQVVRIMSVVPDPSTSTSGSASDQLRDPLFQAALDPQGEPLRATVALPVSQQLPLVEVTWSVDDALTFPLTLTDVLADATTLRRVSVARGNIVVADHGRTIIETVQVDDDLGDAPRLPLRQGPVTQVAPAGKRDAAPVETMPAIELSVVATLGTTRRWRAVRNLLESRPLDDVFVADIESDGRAELRFGDGDYGRRLLDVKAYTATYRIGNGIDGNIGAEGLFHVVRPEPLPPSWPSFDEQTGIVRNPLPATGGVEPESIEEVRHAAPAAFRSGQRRAVTEADYRTAALAVAGVQDAVARFRWTGSWFTAFVGIDPASDSDLILDQRGRPHLSSSLLGQVLVMLESRRLAGYDVEVRVAQYVPIDLALTVCALPGYFRGDVGRAVRQALTRSTLRRLAFFDNRNFTFGAGVYLSKIYAAVEAVPGVDSVEVTTFQRHGRLPAGEIQNGFLGVGPWEIAQVADDPSQPEHGTLTISVGGGS